MGAGSKVLIDRHLHDWLLFNKVVDLLRTQEPSFDGNYLPALDAAEKLLLSNEFGACALTLFFLSDGKPSDRLPRGTMESGQSCMMTGFIKLMGSRIDSLASRFGRRLSVTTVGFGGAGEDFRVLEKLAERPTQFGSVGRFFAAKLNADDLGTAFSSMSSSMNSTKTELTALGGSAQRAVRDVRRQACDTVGRDTRPNSDWFVYMMGEGWRGERLAWAPTGERGWFDIPPLSRDAHGVALKANFFGEGAERLVREFREVGLNGIFVGPPLVAKESRFQADVANMNRKQLIDFHRAFCDTQVRASRLATVFNEKLAQLPGYDPKTTPTISFLDCAVYLVDDFGLGTIGCLVEKQLDPAKYKKWNDNQGFVDGQTAVPAGALEPLGAGGALGALIKEDEEDNEEEDSDEEDAPQPGDDREICVADIPQAFSHFTYRYTRRRVLVCDLQGVLSTHPPRFEFTDPVIHFSSRSNRRNVFGRTDRGLKGVHDFFASHKCGPLCRALNRRWVKRVGEQQRGAHLDGLEDQVSNLTL
eukprot:3614674-Prymnesium_polylepis.1